ncbi:alpha/beta fold hydrolase [Bradyrhizobium elkanii]|uniref:alpha/beta fold hydrolase n=1 Tax=Bradyrhizobium elkanii TaxID=29448 RepID=UPI000841D9A0|nr:hypothetical protein [Bradyrhizobium elkanii]MCP1909738.1 hypothetical protein [Bradyrhizobium elkanii]ODM75119.1 hypothetical protein A6452_39500 [Bradyrhizobium elkanii]ODM82696.1 hypothetical protein A6X20_16265 [Bradyrhizobium elkanii]
MEAFNAPEFELQQVEIKVTNNGEHTCLSGSGFVEIDPGEHSNASTASTMVVIVFVFMLHVPFKTLSAGVLRHATSSARGGLALIATEDRYCGGKTLARRCAERAGANIAVLEGGSHWWMCQQPKQGADAINSFLAKLH